MLLGIDIGTSSVKVVAIDDQGRVHASANVEYPVHRPREGWSEQPAERWWCATIEAIGAISKSDEIALRDVRAVGLSGQMHGAVLLDEAALRNARDGAVKPLRPVILWNDHRSGAQCESMEEAVGGGAELVRTVGNRALPGFTAPKLLWVREHEPAVYAKLAGLALPKDFLALQLTGEWKTDAGDAAGTLLLDVAKRDWHAGVCERVGIDLAILPPVLESSQIAGEITPWAAAQTGLPAGTPVVIGSGDNQAGAVGAGVVAPGMALATLGTSGVFYSHSDAPKLDLADANAPGRTHTMCAADGSSSRRGQWCVTGCMLSAAESLRWASQTIAPNEPIQRLIAEAEAIAPGCDGLLFLPHLSGERCPIPDPQARAGWIGLRAGHTRGHLIRAVLEGVTFTMTQMLDLFRALPVAVDRVRLSGGGNKAELWRQMQADMYNTPVATLQTEEGSAYGAALLAGVGAGVWQSVPEACEAAMHEEQQYEPNEAAVRRYADLRATYDGLYPALRESMHALTQTA